MHHSPAISLKKGNYTVCFHTRHPSRQVLEQMKSTPFQLSFILADKAALECKIYSELDKASTPSVTGDGRKELGSKILRKGSFQDMYVARPTGELPSWCSQGDILVGKVFLDNGVKDATSMDLCYPVPPSTKVKKLKDDKLPEDKDGEKSLEETIFESKVAYLSKQKKNKSAYRELADKLQKENSTHLPLLLELLSSVRDGPLKPDSKKEQIEALRSSVQNFFVADGGPIDEVILAQYLGVAAPSADELEEDQEAKSLKKKMDEHKKALQICRVALSSALGELAVSDSSYLSEFEEFKKCCAFINLATAQNIWLSTWKVIY
uniref:Tripeptidyl peptidase II second Ig-like domain-containing protein n=1 Tax=Amphora coffeiformis TaxID=265554 RepID=A0A6S8JPY9_9STRA